ncbi:MAG: hypothetical protein R3C20_15895 [Planctomycetaceae bacterium]
MKLSLLGGASFNSRRIGGIPEQQLEFLAGIFDVDVLCLSMMSNHLHLILRSRSDVAKDWSDEEVARR